MSRYSNESTEYADSRLYRARHSRIVPALAGCCILFIYALSGCAGELDHDAQDDVGTITSALTVNNSLHSNSLGSNGMALNGMALNGMALNGMALNGMALNGMALNGMALNGMALNGIELNGMALNGMALNGMALNGMALNGMALNGMPLGGISVAQVTLFGQPLTSIQVGDFHNLMQYLSECALDEGQCIEIYDMDASSITYCGVEGLDPGWADNPPDPVQSGVVASCVMERAAAAGDTATHVPVNVEQFKVVLRYLVECALDGGDSLTVYDYDGTALVYDGSLGLAYEWRDSAPTPAGQRRVSACLAARSNAWQEPVHISLRGGGIAVDAVEKTLYSTHEGAFWADLFAAEPYVHTCVVSGGGLSGRVCAESGECGFTQMGACAALCAQHDPNSGAFSDCDGQAEVINTFLNLGDQIRFGDAHNCLTKDDGSAWCWGKNTQGQLGAGETSALEYRAVEVAASNHDWAEIIGGRRHTCGRKRDGSAWCWGSNNHGQLGDSTFTDRDIPVQVNGLGNHVASLSVSEEHSCAHLTNGTLWCWGRNDHGQLGDGTTENRPEPVQVLGLAGGVVARVSGGTRAQTTCAINPLGQLWCWGANNSGQMGTGLFGDSAVPVQVSTDETGEVFDGITDVCSGQRHTCARRVDGTLWCWGEDTHNQMGNGLPATGAARTRPVQVAFSGWAAAGGLSCGDQHACAVDADGALWCWGANDNGQLGSGTYTSVLAPVQVSGLGSPVDTVICAGDHTCAQAREGGLWCWGKDALGLLFGDTSAAAPVAVEIFCDSDGQCEPDQGEDANVCAADCG